MSEENPKPQPENQTTSALAIASDWPTRSDGPPNQDQSFALSPPTEKTMTVTTQKVQSESGLPPNESERSKESEPPPTSAGVVLSARSTDNDDRNKMPQILTLPSLPCDIPNASQPILGQYGRTFVAMSDRKNHYALMVGSKQLNNFIRVSSGNKGIMLKRSDINDANDALIASAELSGRVSNVWSRVAPIDGGIEIDMTDEDNHRIRVTADKVEIIDEGSETLFYRNPVSQPMVMPADHGDLSLLKKYVNLSDIDLLLFKAWLSYTLAHPKTESSKYVHLVLQGDQGTGKSFVCRSIIISLIDPSRLGLQVFPNNAKDMTIAAQNAHVLCYDNMRGFKQEMADVLCMASTGGTISNRALYTDADQYLYNLHAPMVLNGIHSFINQSDLAQRCLCIRTLAMPESKRKSETDMLKELVTDLPVILRGLLDLVSNVFKELPNAQVTNPERMYDFVRWLGAMEKVQDIPAGIYQTVYSQTLHEAQLDSLMENLLASSLIAFTEKDNFPEENKWSGTPAMLLTALNNMTTLREGHFSKEWPQNPIALSKRLNGLKASLVTQGISIELSRGKERTITIVSTNERKSKTSDSITNPEDDF